MQFDDAFFCLLVTDMQGILQDRALSLASCVSMLWHSTVVRESSRSKTSQDWALIYFYFLPSLPSFSKLLLR